MVSSSASASTLAPFGEELTELHSHLGAGVPPDILWEIAHSQGIKLPSKNYWAFEKLITVQPGAIKTLEEYAALFQWTELIQSSPDAVERSVYYILAGAYRKALITRNELRFNPLKRNRGGERDLDHIISAAIRGLDRATLEYPIQAGLILMMDQGFGPKLNAIVLDKAVRYRSRGIIGIDLAGPLKPEIFDRAATAELYEKAKRAGLGVTAHAGEYDKSDVRYAVEDLGVTRIGHGIHAAEDPTLLKLLRDRNVTLEICPSSNLNIGAVKDIDEFKKLLQAVVAAEVPFTINTDGPEMICTSLRKERTLLTHHGILTDNQLADAEEHAKNASFLH